jgi:hypothetical protein
VPNFPGQQFPNPNFPVQNFPGQFPGQGFPGGPGFNGGYLEQAYRGLNYANQGSILLSPISAKKWSDRFES